MRIFISHSSTDAHTARNLARVLTRVGFQVWSPKEMILPGDNWARKAGEALEESDLMVALVTPNALASESVTQEIQYALTSEQYRGRLVPVFIGSLPETSEMPWILRKLNP